MKNYKKQYLDPRWQKKRLEILSRDEFTCTCCGDSENTLNVHHNYYISGRDVWDYQDSCLSTLCNECHEMAHWDSGKLDIKRVQYLYFEALKTDYIEIYHYHLSQITMNNGYLFGNKNEKINFEDIDILEYFIYKNIDPDFLHQHYLLCVSSKTIVSKKALMDSLNG